MYDLKKSKGTFKGLVGECMFKLTRKYAVLSSFFPQNKYFTNFSKYLSINEINFLKKYWRSIDCVEITFNKGKKVVTLYEIKTQNKLNFKKPWWMPKMTKAAEEIYNEAKANGFEVKLAIVELCEDWNYDVIIKDFSPDNYAIDNPKRYDNKNI